MPTPFPGMDPYLERPESWQGFHTELVAALQRDLAPRLRPRYYVALEERVYVTDATQLVGRPDLAVRSVREAEREYDPALERRRAGGAQVLVATLPVPERVHERYLEVRPAGSSEVVTVIELLSPSNKRPGAGREEYERKRLDVLASRTGLVEIDLLRAGVPMPMFLQDASPEGVQQDYRIVIAAGHRRPYADVYAFTVRDPIPDFPLPLRQFEEGPVVSLQRVLHELYDSLGYDLRIDYRGEPVPPLRPADAAWANNLLKAAGRR